ncbi:MAG TPA: DUF2252 family protein [Burkholderiaceae bacterium]|jgi:uncharacterized protein (DUF2252 family)|nr:DUF2252 family protein [Burkholderiaceae bacterium]
MIDVVDSLLQFNRGRDPERLAMKFERMRANAFAFLRGSCHLFYDRLPLAGAFAADAAPHAWICGDAHLENFGSYKGDNRLAYFDLVDFDEATLAPLTWDLVRFLASVLVADDAVKASGDQVERLCEEFLEAYAAVLACGKAGWVERDTAEGLVQALLDDVRCRTRPEFLDRRTVRQGKRRTIRVDGKRALAADADQRAAVVALMDDVARRAPDPSFYEVIDVARRIAGTGSLGVDRFMVLVRGKGSPDGNYLLDLKQALPSAPQRRVTIRQPAWRTEAERVVALQRRMQAMSMAFLEAVDWKGASYILRGLQPTEDRVSLCAPEAGFGGIRGAIRTMAGVMASAHLRSGGRQGSAIADDFVAFGAAVAKWKAPMLEAARQAAHQVEADFALFAGAYDRGQFKAAAR